MTREHKLALIIGFSVVLLVGVLISDHLSRARMDAGVVGDASGDGNGMIAVSTLDEPAALEVRGRDRSAGETTAVDIGRVAMAKQNDDGPLFTLNQSVNRGVDGVDKVVDSSDESLEVDEPLLDEQDTLLNTALAMGRHIIDEAVEIEAPVAAVTKAAKPRAKSRRGSKKAVVLAGKHVVVSGDSLYALAKRYMGSGNQWHELAEANRGVLKGSTKLQLGMTLVVPGIAPPPEESGAAVADLRHPVVVASAGEKVPVAGGRTYTVQTGDTLGEIAQRELGTVRRTADILRVNSGKISDADEIRVGMVLRMPSS